MKPTPFYFFEHTPPGAKKPKRTTYRMTVVEAAQRLPGAVPVLHTEEIRLLPENDDEQSRVSNTGRFNIALKKEI